MSDALQAAWAEAVEHAREINAASERLVTYMCTTFQELTWQEQISLLSLLRAEGTREYEIIADALAGTMARTGKGEPA